MWRWKKNYLGCVGERLESAHTRPGSETDGLCQLLVCRWKQEKCRKKEMVKVSLGRQEEIDGATVGGLDTGEV